MSTPVATIEARREGSSWRLFLADRPVHAGDKLEVLLPGGLWLRCRLEIESQAGELHVALYVPAGGDWERWSPPPGRKLGEEYQVPCDDCGGAGADPDCWCNGTGKRWQQAVPPEPPMLMITALSLEGVSFRWPGER